MKYDLDRFIPLHSLLLLAVTKGDIEELKQLLPRIINSEETVHAFLYARSKKEMRELLEPYIPILIYL